MRGSATGVSLRGQAGTGGAARQLRRISCLVEEREVIGSGVIDCGNAGDAAVKIVVGAGLGAGERGDLAHGEPASALEEKRLGHARANRSPRATQNFVPPPKRNC